MPLVTVNNALLIRDGALVVSEDDKSARGFQAFDGSNRYFKRMGLYDLDCCFGEYPPLNLLRGRRDNPGPSDPDDGYYIIEKEIDCCCPTGDCVIVERVRWYATYIPVGAVVPCPPFRTVPIPATRSDGTQWVPPGAPLTWIFAPILVSQLNTATFGVIIINPRCCNADGSRVYVQLTDEILD